MNDIDMNAKTVWDYMLMHHEMRKADALIVFGSGDLRVPERAAEVYHQGHAPYVICAGGFGKTDPFHKPEANVFAEVMITNGVPAERIFIENKSTNTGENVRFARKLVEEKGLPFHSFILVTKPYMERRVFATFRRQWEGAEAIVTSPHVSYHEYAPDPEFKRKFLNIMVGDLIRIKEYPARGFQIPQEIPAPVWEANQKLVEFGYTTYADATV